MCEKIRPGLKATLLTREHLSPSFVLPRPYTNNFTLVKFDVNRLFSNVSHDYENAIYVHTDDI
ncbi:hypothetical protein WN48_09583 [Eufriesea mexicana]|uniref:Uncharacterized protein n=1 Tax=Eufriesea mexicana TaxID=516756 RepID=A0A310SJV0_9HYME|nr:hypothetical protein WN48_09583 [Eufriesea mexicana]